MRVRLGTRGSDLALWQARHVAAALAPEAEVEIIVLQTRGDRIDDVPLTSVEGKAFFTAEIERALLDGDVDLAVHSHKDLPTESPPGLSVVAVPAGACAAERLLVAGGAFDPDGAWLPLRRGALALLLAAGCAATALAQTEGRVRLIVPTSAGRPLFVHSSISPTTAALSIDSTVASLSACALTM